MDDEDMKIWNYWIESANEKIENYKTVLEKEGNMDILEEAEAEVIPYLSPIRWFMEESKKDERIGKLVDRIMAMEDFDIDSYSTPVLHLYIKSMITIHRYELLNLMRIEKMINE